MGFDGTYEHGLLNHLGAGPSSKVGNTLQILVVS